MSNLYTRGVINIPNVTGDIVITATATQGVVESISAIFNSAGNTIYDTDTLESLRQYLTVNAAYEGGASGSVSSYTMSGTLTAGTCVITVSYAGKTTTFDVTVVHIPLTFTVTNDLTLCTSNNDATTATEFTSYSATLTPDTGYVLDTVSVMMGGSDVTSSVYSNGVINISSVTGDISITVVASKPNLFDKTTITSGYINAYGRPETSSNWYYSALIPVTVGKTYRFTSFNNVNYLTQPHGLHVYDSEGTWKKRVGYARGSGTPETMSCNYTVEEGYSYIRVNVPSEYINDTRFVEV